MPVDPRDGEDKAVTQGIERLMRQAMRGALGELVRKARRNRHIPISHTAARVMALETLA